MRNVIIGFLFFIVLSFGAHSEGLSNDFQFSGGLSLRPKYLFKNGYAFNPGPVVQLWGEVSHKPSGIYLGTWTSIGISHPGNELDGTIGYRTTCLEGEIKMDASASYYRFLEDRWGLYVPQVEVCGKSIPICGMVRGLMPDDGFPSGWMVDGSYAPFSWLSIGVNHAEGTHGALPSTTLRLTPSWNINEHIQIFVMGQYPIQDAGGAIKPQIIGGINISF